uniref:Uncharacterized protein n=1 Tax=Anguilla anguilla TaxID=7936 RepID=A0A0E9VJD1_ANGAN
MGCISPHGYCSISLTSPFLSVENEQQKHEKQR